MARAQGNLYFLQAGRFLPARSVRFRKFRRRWPQPQLKHWSLRGPCERCRRDDLRDSCDKTVAGKTFQRKRAACSPEAIVLKLPQDNPCLVLSATKRPS